MLKTQRLVLAPVLKSELNTLHGILSDAHVRRYLCDDTIFSLAQVEDMLAQSLKHFKEEKFGLWLIREVGSSEAIGFVGLWNFFDEEQPQLIYALLPYALKKGFATEAAAKIIEYGFEELGYAYVTASCDAPNLDSQKVLERIGLSKVKDKMVDGKPLVFFKLSNAANTAHPK
jgi:[ribosomal protein S5]-alanine N-acetyltransferase